MTEGVRELEIGLKSGRAAGPALPETMKLTDLQRRALSENVRRAITKTVEAVKKGAGKQSLINQLARQIPEARAALIDALKGTGVNLPAGW